MTIFPRPPDPSTAQPTLKLADLVNADKLGPLHVGTSNATNLTPGAVHDRHGRRKRKLRISLTDRCNFRCPYCMPETPQFMPREDRLTRDEIRRLLLLFVAELGITELRLTGGEPLLRRDLADIISDCQPLRDFGLERISLTSNGALLSSRASELKAAGLDDLNISLDSLTPETFTHLSGGRSIESVREGIAAARTVGLPIKLNSVILRDINESEILPLARYAIAERIPLRFIEFMPLDGRGEWSKDRVVPEAEILQILKQEFPRLAATHTAEIRGAAPANTYAIGHEGEIGIIATVSNPFCASCDRLRLTADGSLYTCLFSNTGTPLRPALRNGAPDSELLNTIRQAVWNKEAGYISQPGYAQRPIAMNHLGG